MNELTPQHLDQMAYQSPQPPVDDRKPLRKFIDDTVMPNMGMIAAAPMAAISALSNLQRVPRMINV